MDSQAEGREKDLPAGEKQVRCGCSSNPKTVKYETNKHNKQHPRKYTISFYYSQKMIFYYIHSDTGLRRCMTLFFLIFSLTILLIIPLQSSSPSFLVPILSHESPPNSQHNDSTPAQALPPHPATQVEIPFPSHLDQGIPLGCPAM